VDEPAAEQAHQAAEEAVAKAAAQLSKSQPVPVTVRAVSGLPPRNSSRPRAMLTCWWWAPGAAVASRGWCWARSATKWHATRTALSWSCQDQGRAAAGYPVESRNSAGPLRGGL
jgi:hypothetical protein